VLAKCPPQIGQKKTPAFPNPWRAECSGGARRRAWNRLGRCRAFSSQRQHQHVTI
jgi:hypothetical protein